jgi:hypothetical protein
MGVRLLTRWRETMDTVPIITIEQLLEEAAHYRRLARGSIPWQLVERLELWAEDYERQAADLVAAQLSRAA